MITILDGDVEQLLQYRSKLKAINMRSARSMLEEPDLVCELHAEYIVAWVNTGESNIGACREIEPAHIAELSQRFGGVK